MFLLVVWLLLFLLMVAVLLLGGSLLLFDCGQGSGYCYAVSCMPLCHDCSFCSGCKILFFLHSALLWPCSLHLKQVGPFLGSEGFGELSFCSSLQSVGLVAVL